MKRILVIPLITFFIFSCQSARGTVVDFETLSDCSVEGLSTPQGFGFLAADTHLCIQQAITKELIYLEFSTYRDLSIIMSGSGPFSLNSFEANEYGVAATINITGSKVGGGIVNWSVGLDGTAGKQTFYLPDTFVNLSSVTFLSPNRTKYYLDNITVNETFSPVSLVPIPGSLPLMLSGLMLLYVRCHRRFTKSHWNRVS